MDTDWPVFRVRDTFIKFFEKKKEHTFWASSKVIPHEDPTLLFANAGMNQVFTDVSHILICVVQAHFSWDCGPEIGSCQVDSRRKFSKVYPRWWKAQ